LSGLFTLLDQPSVDEPIMVIFSDMSSSAFGLAWDLITALRTSFLKRPKSPSLSKHKGNFLASASSNRFFETVGWSTSSLRMASFKRAISPYARHILPCLNNVACVRVAMRRNTRVNKRRDPLWYHARISSDASPEKMWGDQTMNQMIPDRMKQFLRNPMNHPVNALMNQNSMSTVMIVVMELGLTAFVMSGQIDCRQAAPVVSASMEILLEQVLEGSLTPLVEQKRCLRLVQKNCSLTPCVRSGPVGLPHSPMVMILSSSLKPLFL